MPPSKCALCRDFGFKRKKLDADCQDPCDEFYECVFRRLSKSLSQSILQTVRGHAIHPSCWHYLSETEFWLGSPRPPLYTQTTLLDIDYDSESSDSDDEAPSYPVPICPPT